MRELQILILNPQHNEELYRTVIQKYPNACITTVGETDRDTSKGNSTHIQVQFSKVQEYSLFTTLGKPNIDLMIINPPVYQKTRFEDSSYNPYLEFERMFHLFQMISPTHWIFMRMESNHDLQSQAHNESLSSLTFLSDCNPNITKDKFGQISDIVLIWISPKDIIRCYHSSSSERILFKMLATVIKQFIHRRSTQLMTLAKITQFT